MYVFGKFSPFFFSNFSFFSEIKINVFFVANILVIILYFINNNTNKGKIKHSHLYWNFPFEAFSSFFTSRLILAILSSILFNSLIYYHWILLLLFIYRLYVHRALSDYLEIWMRKENKLNYKPSSHKRKGPPIWNFKKLSYLFIHCFR